MTSNDTFYRVKVAKPVECIERNPFQLEYSFTADELGTIRQHAAARQAPKDLNPSMVQDKRIMARDNVETHTIGLLGEYAVAKTIGATLDVNAYLSGDVTHDLSLFGVSIEVKTLQGYLAFRSIKEFTADVATLVIHQPGTLDRVWIQGWITKADFAGLHFIDNFGYGDRPCVEPSQMTPISTLRAYCTMTRNLRWIAARLPKQVES